MAVNTFPAGVSLTANLLQLKRRGQLVQDIFAPDTLVCKVYSDTGVELEVEDDAIDADGLGNYSYTFVAPPNPGTYYLIWESVVSGDVGRHRFNFQLRNDHSGY